MSDEREKIEHLCEVAGIGEEEARARLADDDLFVTPAEYRYVFEGEDGIRQVREAEEYLRGMAGGADNSGAVNEALKQFLVDVAERAGEFLRRIQERAGET